MKIYRLTMLVEAGVSAGFSWHSSERDARRARREFLQDTEMDETAEASIQAIEFEPTRGGILGLLNQYGHEPQNG